jgi:transcriptional regulator with XRE-family HTH domain
LGAYPHSPRWKLMCRRLRDARKRAGLKQAEVAAALGTTQNFVSKCETGQRRIDPIELADFAALYGTTLATLVPAENSARGDKARRVAEALLKPRRGRGGRRGRGER